MNWVILFTVTHIRKSLLCENLCCEASRLLQWLWHPHFSLWYFVNFNGYSHLQPPESCQVKAEINFPESLVYFYTIGQNSIFSCVLRLIYIKGADFHKAKVLRVIYSATLNLRFFFFSFYKCLLSLTKSLLKSFWKSQANLKFEISLSCQLTKTTSKNSISAVSDPHRDWSLFIIISSDTGISCVLQNQK